MSNNASDFQPNWASTPGDTITDILKKRELSINEFAKRMDSSIDGVKELLHGFVSINDDIATKLEKALGASAIFWLNRENQYRQSMGRIKHTVEEKWIKELPVKDMINYGWITRSPNLTDECLSYFSVPDVWAWKNKYREVVAATSFRKSAVVNSKPTAVAAWLRQGEIQSQKIECQEWNSKLFEQTLVTNIRPLMKNKNPKQFLPLLKKMCSECGVAVVIAKNPAGCTASGATMFGTQKATMLLSFRYMTDDHFWFTFFHEAAHLLLHSDKHLFIEEDRDNNEAISKEEQEANEFSRDMLIPKSLQDRLSKMAVVEANIKDIARRADVPLGIVIGQLQNLERVPHSNLNKYKRRYEWSDILS